MESFQEDFLVYSRVSALVNRLSIFLSFRYFQTIGSSQGCFFIQLEAQMVWFQFNFLPMQPLEP